MKVSTTVYKSEDSKPAWKTGEHIGDGPHPIFCAICRTTPKHFHTITVDMMRGYGPPPNDEVFCTFAYIICNKCYHNKTIAWLKDLKSLRLE